MSQGDFGDIDDSFTGDPTGNEPENDDTDSDVFPDLPSWVEKMWCPSIALNLSDGNRGRTWCAKWWKHPPVGVRLYAVWRAWEKAVRSGDDHALSAWWTYDADPALRALSDGEVGPMHSCSPTQHRDVPRLPCDPIPADDLDALAIALVTTAHSDDLAAEE
ncbi:DUF4913 domain-containing protein [Nocardia sp. NPDC004722]